MVTAEAEDSQYQGTDNSEASLDAFMAKAGFERIREHLGLSYSRDPTYVNARFRHLLPFIFYLQHS